MKFKLRLSALLLAILISVSALAGCDTLFPTESTPADDGFTSDPGDIGGDSFDGSEDDPGSDVPGDPYPEPDPSIIPTSDPYTNVSKEEFYANYTPARCYQDAVYRSAHNLMSGSIASQDQAPTVAKDQPKDGGMLVRNTSAIYRENGNAYVVIDKNGKEAFRVYKGGAYVTLEEVAAYVYAFGDVPANYVSDKKTSPQSNPWKEYLRLNHSSFSGSTSKYPYEPELPNISGCGGDLYYYEIDIGTTGTDCDPSYSAVLYNNGSRITRGAARIVYTRYDKNRNNIIDPNEKFVFYTYNHYNDFQEYLNYEGGWGEIFGNITGGGKISNKYNCNPTPYVAVARRDFTVKGQKLSTFYVFDQRATEGILSSLFTKNAA